MKEYRITINRNDLNDKEKAILSNVAYFLQNLGLVDVAKNYGKEVLWHLDTDNKVLFERLKMFARCNCNVSIW